VKLKAGKKGTSKFTGQDDPPLMKEGERKNGWERKTSSATIFWG